MPAHRAHDTWDDHAAENGPDTPRPAPDPIEPDPSPPPDPRDPPPYPRYEDVPPTRPIDQSAQRTSSRFGQLASRSDR
jgi:hypothetical protein